MALSGHSDELLLADLIQANILGRNTCRVQVATNLGRGSIYIDAGEVTDAAYGNLVGADAFHALVAADDVHFLVESGLTSQRRTIHEGWQRMMLNTMQLRDEGRLPKPLFATMKSTDTQPLPVAAAKLDPVPVPAAPAPRTASTRPLLLGGAALGLLILAAGGFYLFGQAGLQPVAKPQATATPGLAVEASSLTHPGDSQPTLVDGKPPVAPDRTLAVMPTIVCRLLVDESGAVKEAKIFRSRLDLERFEDAAIDAVRSFRFQPARKGGQPVSAWINWPVEFQQ